jgi:hypothetical protein
MELSFIRQKRYSYTREEIPVAEEVIAGVSKEAFD